MKAGGQYFIGAYVVAPYNTVILNDLGILMPGELLEGSQGTSGSITVWASGMEVS